MNTLCQVREGATREEEARRALEVRRAELQETAKIREELEEGRGREQQMEGELAGVKELKVSTLHPEP